MQMIVSVMHGQLLSMQTTPWLALLFPQHLLNFNPLVNQKKFAKLILLRALFSVMRSYSDHTDLRLLPPMTVKLIFIILFFSHKDIFSTPPSSLGYHFLNIFDFPVNSP